MQWSPKGAIPVQTESHFQASVGFSTGTPRTAALFAELTESEIHLAQGRVGAGMQGTFSALAQLRSLLSVDEWQRACESTELQRLRGLLYEDPHVHRAFAKPRGYAGDAVLLDFIYGCIPLPDHTTPLGRRIYRWCAENTVAFQSVRQRRVLLAEILDRTAQRRPNGRVLSIACGHLREAQLSSAFVGGAIGEIVAVDQDPYSLEVVRSTYAGLPIRCVQATVGDIVKGRLELGEFDHVYAAGLYDYLPDGLARRLTAALWSRLAPGGELTIANFVPFREAAYMEAVMDWHLLYRTEAELRSVASDLDGAHVRSWTDSGGAVAYLSVARC
jgi:SAM-dependent methyltransferase